MVDLLKNNQRNEPVTRPTLSIESTEHGYSISIAFKNPETGRIITKKAALRFSDNQKAKLGLTEGMMLGLLQRLVAEIPIEDLRNQSKRGMSSMIHHTIRKLSRRKVYGYLKKKYEQEGIRKRCEIENTRALSVAPHASGATAANRGEVDAPCSFKEQLDHDIRKVILRQPSSSFFAPEKTGVTHAVIGKSFCGKTHFIVEQLNKLTQSEITGYSAIIFFTESTSAMPLKDIKKSVLKRMIVIDRFCPGVLLAIKKINDGTCNKFNFLVIFDDIIQLRGILLSKSILTLRNSNISTVISIQYEKLLSPAQRSSVHNMYLFNLRAESWEYMLKGYLLGNFKDKLPSLRDDPTTGKSKKVSTVAQGLRETMDGTITHYDQRKDCLDIYSIGKEKKTLKRKRSDDEYGGDSESSSSE